MRKSLYGKFSGRPANIAVISTDTEGRVTVFNRQAEEILGYIPEEIIGQQAPIKDFESFCGHIEEQKNIPNEAQLIHKSGELIGMEIITSPIKNNQGATAGYLFTATRVNTDKSITGTEQLPDMHVANIVLEREIRRTEREGQPLSVLKIDIDFYKSYRKEYGEAETQICLNHVAQVLAERIQRASDFLAYPGHDEFLVILPNTDMPGTVKVAEQLRLRIAALNLEHKASEIGKIVTASIGIANLVPERETTLADVLAIADKGLKEAKSDGRNCSRIG